MAVMEYYVPGSRMSCRKEETQAVLVIVDQACKKKGKKDLTGLPPVKR